MILTVRAILSMLGIAVFAGVLSIIVYNQGRTFEAQAPYYADSTPPPSRELPGIPGLPPGFETESASSTKPEQKPETKPATQNQEKPATNPPPQVTTPPSTQSTNTASFGAVNTKTRAALVNIFCSTKAGGAIHPFSGSGVVIDPRGIILTNAHLAQYFLLKDYPVAGSVSCTIRTGSPAREMYKAELLYLPKKWVDAHAKDIVSQNPTGTGEHDYALLYITESSNPSLPLPTTFPYIDVDVSAVGLIEGVPLLIAAYPAEFVGSITTLRDLYISSSIATIKKIYTFSLDLPDLIGMTGNVVAQKGASGGAFVDSNGKLVGLVVTTTEESSTGDRQLNAASLAHINRSMLAHTGGTLKEFLEKDPKNSVAIFAENEFAGLAKKLTDVLSTQ